MEVGVGAVRTEKNGGAGLKIEATSLKPSDVRPVYRADQVQNDVAIALGYAEQRDVSKHVLKVRFLPIETSPDTIVLVGDAAAESERESMEGGAGRDALSVESEIALVPPAAVRTDTPEVGLGVSVKDVADVDDLIGAVEGKAHGVML